MNAGNRVKSYRKWLFNLPVLKVIETEEKNGVRFELRKAEKGLVLVRYEDDEYDSSILEWQYGKCYFQEILNNLRLSGN